MVTPSTFGRLGLRAPGNDRSWLEATGTPGRDSEWPDAATDAAATEGRHGDGGGVGCRGRVPERRCRAMASRPAACVPLDGIAPGTYELRVTVADGVDRAVRWAQVTIGP